MMPASTHVPAAAGGDVLAAILAQQSVTDGETSDPLHSHISEADAVFITRLIQETRPQSSSRSGMAGTIFSTLIICGELERLGLTTNHIVIDPFQRTDWRGIGLRNVRAAGYDKFVEFHEERSEYVLPRLAHEGRRLDFALIDGWHSFDHALVEFFFIKPHAARRRNRRCSTTPTGPASASCCASWISSLPAYEVYAAKNARCRSAGSEVCQRLGDSSIGRQVFHPSLRRRPWELGIFQRCVALRKISEDTRDMKWPNPTPDKAMFSRFLDTMRARYRRVLFLGGGGRDLLSSRWSVRRSPTISRTVRVGAKRVSAGRQEQGVRLQRLRVRPPSATPGVSSTSASTTT